MKLLPNTSVPPAPPPEPPCATIDFETYSEAGFVWDEDGQKWLAPPGATKKGIFAVGAPVYAEHVSLEVLVLRYRIPGDPGVSMWLPGLPAPGRLLQWIANGGLIEAHNVMFERMVWHFYCHLKLGWPNLPPAQLRCSKATANVNNLPGALANLTTVLPVKTPKDADGKRLLNKFSIPRKPTKKDPRLRIRPEEDPVDGLKLYDYCGTDIIAEEGASHLMEPMSADERRFWLLDQEMNWKGIGVDVESVRNMIAVLEQAQERYGQELRDLTGGLEPTQVQALRGWLAGRGVSTTNLDAEAIEELLARPDLPADCRRVVEIRELVGSASVKKLYAFERCTSRDGRIRDIITHHGARTGRPKGGGVQPLNMPKDGPKLIWCESCNHPSKPHVLTCPWCSAPVDPLTKQWKWPSHPDNAAGWPVDLIQQIMATRDLDTVERFFGPALKAITGCMRGMFVAGPDMDLIASDYSAIEAVVTAMLAGCQWRIDTFRRKEDIYLASASSITGTHVEEYKRYKAENDDDHPHRQKIGKVAELALGFGGWLGAWRKFDPDGAPDAEVKRTILAWRDASPEIVEMWGGQTRGKPWMREYRLERFGFEGAFVNAVQYPGTVWESNGIWFYMRGDMLVIRLLSGREMKYHEPRLWERDKEPGVFDITYMTWNSNPMYGPIGWGPMNTYGPKTAENVVQAIAHDIQRYGIERLWDAGYETVLHIYDENVAEVSEGFGTIEEFEAIMSQMPPWAADWPIRAAGGWRGKRFRKD